MDGGDTVYINDNPIGETEVYHADRHHVTTVRRWRDDYIRESTVAKALGDGLRPCQKCYPTEAGRTCPSCGYEGDLSDVLAKDQKWCNNDDCRVVSFHAPPDPDG